MIYLKLFEGFGSGVEEIHGNSWWVRDQVMRRYNGSDYFNRYELKFFRNFFIKSDKYDFFGVSGEKLKGRSVDGVELSGERRTMFRARYMPTDNRLNPIEIKITRLKDEYFMVEISCLSRENSRFSEYSQSATPTTKIYIVDSFEDMKDFLFNIKHYWEEINKSWKPK